MIHKKGSLESSYFRRIIWQNSCGCLFHCHYSCIIHFLSHAVLLSFTSEILHSNGKSDCMNLWRCGDTKNPSLCPYQRKIKPHAWMTGGPLLWPPSSASVLRSLSENTSALCCRIHWTHYNLHTAVTVPQTMLLPSPCTLLSPTWKIRTPMWGCCSWIIVRHLTP